MNKGVMLYENVIPTVVAYDSSFKAVEILLGDFECKCGVAITTNRIETPFCPNCTRGMYKVAKPHTLKLKLTEVEKYPVAGRCVNCRATLANYMGLEIYSKTEQINCVMCSATVDLL